MKQTKRKTTPETTPRLTHRPTRPPLTGRALLDAMNADAELAAAVNAGFDEIERGEYVSLAELRAEFGDL